MVYIYRKKNINKKHDQTIKNLNKSNLLIAINGSSLLKRTQQKT